MTTRDRIVLMCIAVLVVIGAGWELVVSPKRKEATKLATQVTEAQKQLSTAEGQLANARQAQAQYSSAYASIVNLGKAVPTGEQVPSLIYEIAQASGGKNVDFSSIVAGSGSGSASATPGASSSPAGAATAAAGFTQLPFTFVFEGGFSDLERFFHQLDSFATRTTSGTLDVSGRLLTIQSIKLGPSTTGATAATVKGPPKLAGTVTATAYVLPASQGLTAGATAAAPAGAAPAASSSSSGASSPAAPAIVRVTP
jgi:Type II secretion system (T2SS), protein M